MKLINLFIFNILLVNISFGQVCNEISIFSNGRVPNKVQYVKNKIELENQTWFYKVTSGQPKPSFIFLHIPCVNLVEVGIVLNGNKIRKNLVNHTNVQDPLINDYGWKLEFYSDTIYITTMGLYDVKPIFISMKYGQLITKDTICGPDCVGLDINYVNLEYTNNFLILRGNSDEMFELEISRDGLNWNFLSYIFCDYVYFPQITPGDWYVRAKSDDFISDVIKINIEQKKELIYYDELGRVINKYDNRNIKPYLFR